MSDQGTKPLVYIDTETTGIENGRLIELAYLTDEMEEPHVVRVKPPIPITVDAMSVHHITPAMLVGSPAFSDHPDAEEIRHLVESSQLVAHNAEYDVGVLEREGFWLDLDDAICTKQVARRLYPELPRHSLQFLRYALEANVPGAVPHTAAGDVLVLRSVFQRLVNRIMEDQGTDREGAIAAMRALKDAPILLVAVPPRFKKHAGEPFVEVNKIDRGYIEWMFKELEGGKIDDPDLAHTIDHYFKRRTI